MLAAPSRLDQNGRRSTSWHDVARDSRITTVPLPVDPPEGGFAAEPADATEITAIELMARAVSTRRGMS